MSDRTISDRARCGALVRVGPGLDGVPALLTDVAAGHLTLDDVGDCLDRVGGRRVAGSGRLAEILRALRDGPFRWRIGRKIAGTGDQNRSGSRSEPACERRRGR